MTPAGADRPDAAAKRRAEPRPHPALPDAESSETRPMPMASVPPSLDATGRRESLLGERTEASGPGGGSDLGR